MNRVYQGRISKVEFLSGDKNADVEQTVERSELEKEYSSPLWHHHELFSDACAYWMVALASLAHGAADVRLSGDLIERVRDAWEKFPRDLPGQLKSNAKGLRKSVGPWLGLGPEATLEDAFEVIDENSGVSPETRFLALSLLLDRCGGDAAIQQGGRGYFPRFCDENAKPTWDFSPGAIASAAGKSQLATVLHSDSAESALVEMAKQMDLSWTVKTQPGKYYTTDESKERLNEGIKHFEEILSGEELSRTKTYLSDVINAAETLKSFREMTTNWEDELAIPRNRKASKDLTFATLLFQHFPSKFTGDLLKLYVAAPKASVKPKESDLSPQFDKLGDDPIKLARGERGWVFRAFTALPAWAPESPGKPVWKEFDIAALKEALKGFSQFNQKTKEREADERYLKGKLAVLLGSREDGWKPRATESGEDTEQVEPLDPELFALAVQLESRLSEELLDTIVSLDDGKDFQFGEATYQLIPGSWKISRAALRGFSTVAERWNKLFEKGYVPAKSDLEDVAKAFQRDEKNRKSLGSMPLFLALCEEKFWPIWRCSDEVSDRNDFLYRMMDFHGVVRDFRRSLEKIRLTPPEPRHSRRLYMFSDVKDKTSKVVFGGDGDSSSLDCAIAFGKPDSGVSQKRIRIHYSAPRLRRDGLLGGDASEWLQPMTKALGLTPPDSEESFDSAVSLMPDFTRDGKLRLLLNFPKTLDPSWIHNGIGKSNRWNGQFNGVKGKNLHLHWPGTGATKGYKDNPWHGNSVIRNGGFTLLSVDLGQRSAGAWALIRVTASDPRVKSNTKRPVRFLGSDGEVDWYGEVEKIGMFRLPGEEQKVIGELGKRIIEPFGKRGRYADIKETREGLELVDKFREQQEESEVENFESRFQKRSFPEQNDELIRLANRRLTRLSTFHRWSCLSAKLKDLKDSPERIESVLKALREEIDHWTDSEVVEWRAVLNADKFEEFASLSGKKFLSLRDELIANLVELSNRVVPLRKGIWKWEGDCGKDVPRELVIEDFTHEKLPKIRGQRGLSMERLEQLENLRKLFLRLNRACEKKQGVQTKVGFGFGNSAGEPCTDLLRKIDRMKEERINQTAHLILANALGVRLKNSKMEKKNRRAYDIHGEYEVIPGREPVDFIAIENLDRYLTSQGRAPSENRRLMKWAHRAVRDKLKMLSEESFGIPVVEAAAAYSSRFCARTGQVGSRCVERSGLSFFEKEMLSKKGGVVPKGGGYDFRELYQKLAQQFEKLETMNLERRQRKKPLYSLLLPREGGPLFLPAISGGATQADANAAVNIGLRAAGSPQSLEILHKIRTDRKKGNLVPRLGNKREKAAFDSNFVICDEESLSNQSTRNPNFFFDGLGIAEFDKATISLKEGIEDIPVASSLGLFSSARTKVMKRIVSINQSRLDSWEDSLP